METLLDDLKCGARVLAKNPGFTIVAVLALALGIGANTAIFTVVNAVLLRPLPFHDPDRLVSIRIANQRLNVNNALASYSDILEWKQQSHSFDFISAYSPSSANLATGEEPERVSLWKVNASFFPMLGVRVALGRGFLPQEDQPGAPRVAILSQALWRQRFGSDPGLVGRSVVIDGNPYTVVGILPPGFRVEDDSVDLYAPIARSGARGPDDDWVYGAYARLKAGVPIERVQAELNTINHRLIQQYHRPITDFRVQVWGLHEYMVRDVRLSLVILLAAVTLVLLIACVNVANLLLARAGARQKEIAIRAALGAGRWRVVRQLLTESVLLSLLGGISGLLLAYWGVMAFSGLGTGGFPMLKQSRLDLSVLAFTTLISLLTGLLFGIAPALTVSRASVLETLKEGGVVSTASLGMNRLRGLLMVTELAIALPLLIGASLMIRSFLKLQEVNPGFNPDGVLTAAIDLPATNYSKAEQQIEFFRQLEERLEATPGVTASGMTSVLPLSGNNQGEGLLIEGRPVSGPADVPILWLRVVNTQYFQAMQIPLLKGRLFAEQDSKGAPRVLIVNAAMARRYWPDQDPIGKRVGTGKPEDWMSVVGVVGDVHHVSLAQAPDVEIFLPFTQNPRPGMRLVLRTSSDPLSLAPILRRTVKELDREQPVSKVASMEQNRSDSVATKRFSTLLLGIFAAVALMLAAIGIYGVVSFSVSRRRHEIGVRLALGARRADVVRMVVGRGTLLALVGVAIGLGLALALTRVIASLLYGVKPTDPLVFVGVSLLLALVAALASYLPARRASHVDPIVTLRCE